MQVITEERTALPRPCRGMMKAKHDRTLWPVPCRWPPVLALVTAGAGILAVVRAAAFLRLLRSYPPGSGRSLSLLMAMRGGYAKKVCLKP